MKKIIVCSIALMAAFPTLAFGMNGLKTAVMLKGRSSLSATVAGHFVPQLIEAYDTKLRSASNSSPLQSQKSVEKKEIPDVYEEAYDASMNRLCGLSSDVLFQVFDAIATERARAEIFARHIIALDKKDPREILQYVSMFNKEAQCSVCFQLITLNASPKLIAQCLTILDQRQLDKLVQDIADQAGGLMSFLTSAIVEEKLKPQILQGQEQDGGLSTLQVVRMILLLKRR